MNPPVFPPPPALTTSAKRLTWQRCHQVLASFADRGNLPQAAASAHYANVFSFLVALTSLMHHPDARERMSRLLVGLEFPPAVGKPSFALLLSRQLAPVCSLHPGPAAGRLSVPPHLGSWVLQHARASRQLLHHADSPLEIQASVWLIQLATLPVTSTAFDAFKRWALKVGLSPRPKDEHDLTPAIFLPSEALSLQDSGPGISPDPPLTHKTSLTTR